MLGVEIQGTSSRNCSPGAPRSNQASRPSEAAKMPSELTSAQKRLVCAEDGRGRQRAMRKAASGRMRARGGGGCGAERPKAAGLRRRRARQAEGDEERGQRQDEDQGEEVHRGRPPKRPMATISATEPKRIQVA